MQKFKGVIYQAINIQNKKSYIGKTTQDFECYKQNHIDNALIKKIKKRFYDSIRKHGEHNFKWIILGEIESYNLEDLNYQLNEAEKECILIFRTFGSNGETYDNIYGYNMTPGGDGLPKGTEPWNKGKDMSIETKEKLRKVNLGKKQSDKTKKKRSISLKGKTKGRISPRKGKKYEEIYGEERSNIEKQKRSEGLKDRTYEEIYGLEEALKQKEKLRIKKLGKKQSIESNKKRSDALKGKKRKPHTKETKEKISTRLIGRKSSMEGKSLTEDTKKKIKYKIIKNHRETLKTGNSSNPQYIHIDLNELLEKRKSHTVKELAIIYNACAGTIYKKLYYAKNLLQTD